MATTGSGTGFSVTLAAGNWNPLGMDESGWMPLQSDVSGTVTSPAMSRFHQFEITLTPDAGLGEGNGDWRGAEIQGIQVRATAGGAW